MSLDNTTDVIIRIRTIYEGGEAVSQAVRETTRSFDEHGQQVTKVTNSIVDFETKEKTLVSTINATSSGITATNQSLAEFSRVVGTIRSIVAQASITVFVFSMMIRRVSESQRSLTTAQENATEAIRKYGRFSLEATQALRRVESAQEAVNMVNVEFAIQTVLTVASVGTMIAEIGKLMVQLGLLKASYLATGVARSFAFGGIIGAVAGAAIGISIGSMVFGGNKSEDKFEEQWSEAGRYVQRERRRQAK